jgi:hypothetical protein
MASTLRSTFEKGDRSKEREEINSSTSRLLNDNNALHDVERL